MVSVLVLQIYVRFDNVKQAQDKPKCHDLDYHIIERKVILEQLYLTAFFAFCYNDLHINYCISFLSEIASCGKKRAYKWKDYSCRRNNLEWLLQKMQLIQPNKYWELKDVQALNTELNKKYFSLVRLEILLA